MFSLAINYFFFKIKFYFSGKTFVERFYLNFLLKNFQKKIKKVVESIMLSFPFFSFRFVTITFLTSYCENNLGVFYVSKYETK
jgi:hypothetical protein